MNRMYIGTKEINEIRNSYDFSKTNKPWNDAGLNHRSNVGSLMELCKKNTPKTYRDFAEKYEADTSHRPMEDVAEDFYQYLKDNTAWNISRETALKYVYIRVIYETFLGYQKELYVIKHIQNWLKDGYTIIPANSILDFDYSVDAEIFDKDKNLVCGIQIKSQKYHDFHEKNNTSVHIVNKKKNSLYTNKYGVPVKYVHYKKYVVETENISDLCVG